MNKFIKNTERKNQLFESIESNIEYSEHLHEKIVTSGYPEEKVNEHIKLQLLICDDLKELNRLINNQPK